MNMHFNISCMYAVIFLYWSVINFKCVYSLSDEEADGPQPPTPPPRRFSTTTWGLKCIKRDVALSRSFSNIADGLRIAHAHTLAVAGVSGVVDAPPPSSPRPFSNRKGTRASFHGRGIPRPHNHSSLFSPSHTLPKSCPQSPALPRPHRSLPAISNADKNKLDNKSRFRLHMRLPQDYISLQNINNSQPLMSPRVPLAALSPRPSPRNLPRPSLYRSSLSRSNPNLSSASTSSVTSDSQLNPPLTVQSCCSDERDKEKSIWDISRSNFSLDQQETKDPFPLLQLSHVKVSNPNLLKDSSISLCVNSSETCRENVNDHSKFSFIFNEDKSSDSNDPCIISSTNKFTCSSGQDKYNSYRSLDQQDSPPLIGSPVESRFPISMSYPLGFVNPPSIIHRHQVCTKTKDVSNLDENYVLGRSSDVLSLREIRCSPVPSPNPSICSLPLHSSTNHKLKGQKSNNHHQLKSSPRNHYHHLRYLHHHHNMFPSMSSLRLFSSSSGLIPGALEWDFKSSSGGEGVGGESSFYRANPIAPSTPNQQTSPNPPPSTPPSRIGCDPSNPVLFMSLR